MAKINGKYLNDIEDMLSPELQAEYRQVKASYNAHKAKQQAFEELLAVELGVDGGKRLACSYRFGKLSISVEDSKPVASKPVVQKINLAQWLEQQSR
jgi:hypothetical protein